ncbi:MAG: hypothetical protein WCA45_07285 [Thiobacillaceae bacterium]
MNRKTFVACTLAVAGACLGSTASAADLPKSGTYSAHYGWTFSGQVQELGTHRTVYAGVVAGVIFNDAGKGFLHKARVDCPIYNDVNQGRAHAIGACVVMDADGDKIFMEWECTGAMPACPGDERFVGGTGKYKGISGNSKFQGNFIGGTGGGWSDWKGEYRLP